MGEPTSLINVRQSRTGKSWAVDVFEKYRTSSGGEVTIIGTGRGGYHKTEGQALASAEAFRRRLAPATVHVRWRAITDGSAAAVPR